MKNNKKLTYLLLAAVLAIWGIIVVRMVSPSSGDADNFVIEDPILKTNYRVEMDTFSIVANYRDPFLGKRYSSSRPHRTSMPRAKIKKTPIIPEKEEVKLVWPKLGYKGVINSGSNEIGILVYNGNERIVAPGDSLKGLFIKSIYDDSVVVNYKTQTRIIKK